MGIQKRFWRRRFLAWVLATVLVIMIISLIRSIYYLSRQQGQLTQAQERVVELQEKQAELEAQKEYFESDEYIQKEARDRLNMSLPGEAVVVLPAQEQEEAYSGLLDSQKPVWRQWLEHFNLI